MLTADAREQALNQLRSQVASLPDDSPKKALLTEILNGRPSPDAQHAQHESLRRIALERYQALADTDPLKAVLGKLINGSEQPVTVNAHAAPTGQTADVWGVVDALRQRDESLFKGLQVVDARSAAAMEEAQRLAAKAVELQELLNMVLEEVHINTAMLKSLKQALPPQP